MITRPDYDVLIAGGGMVGATLALQLSSHSDKPLKVLLVESFPLPENQQQPVYQPSFDARSTALSYGSRWILEKLGLWQQLATHLAAIETIHVSDRGRLGSVTMTCQEMDWPALGYVVENAWLGTVLLTALRETTGVTILSPAVVDTIKPRDGFVEVSIDQGEQTETVSTQLVVIADGADSDLCKQLGIASQLRDYQQTAIIANVSCSQPHQQCAYERFTTEGPMALLPLTQAEQSALVWTMSAEQAQQRLAADEADFLQQLQSQFGHRQGQFVRLGQRASYPLKLIEAAEQVRSGIVVMGNAAHSLHPVAGQGFNLALRDCTRLTTCLIDAHYHNRPLGDLALLQSYLQQQRYDQQKTLLFSDRVVAMFSQRQWAASVMRDVGLIALDLVPPLKKSFIRHAAGLHDGAALGV